MDDTQCQQICDSIVQQLKTVIAHRVNSDEELLQKHLELDGKGSTVHKFIFTTHQNIQINQIEITADFLEWKTRLKLHKKHNNEYAIKLVMFIRQFPKLKSNSSSSSTQYSGCIPITTRTLPPCTTIT
jgi:hypothetical protein